MNKENVETLKQKLDLISDLTIENLKSAINMYKNQAKNYNKYREKPEIKIKLNEYAKIKMREMRARRKLEKQENINI